MSDIQKQADALRKMGDGSNFDRPLMAKDATLRDYFAAKAMEGELASLEGGGIRYDESNKVLLKLTTHWYRIADAMLKARQE
jgi:hypothetical protein